MGELINAAIQENDLQRVKELVQNGININKRDENGRTALMQASCEKHLKILEYLLNNGANPNNQDAYGWTSLMYISCFGSHLVAKYLVRNGADMNIRCHFEGRTALMHLVGYRKMGMVRYLVMSGADLNIKDCDGKTAFDIAKKCGNIKAAKFIKFYPKYLAHMRQWIPELAPRISLASCERIFSFI